MAIGRLAAVAVTGNGNLTDIYTVPASTEADVNITIANSADTDTEIRVVHVRNGNSGAATAADYLIGGASTGLPTSRLADNRAPISITGIPMQAGDTIGVSSSASDVAVSIHGITQGA